MGFIIVYDIIIINWTPPLKHLWVSPNISLDIVVDGQDFAAHALFVSGIHIIRYGLQYCYDYYYYYYSWPYCQTQYMNSEKNPHSVVISQRKFVPAFNCPIRQQDNRDCFFLYFFSLRFCCLISIFFYYHFLLVIFV